ncbi:MAG TPA: hypothetical protein VHA12_01860 [Candidatus Nanoarchaeia archaeon]|nr:hypothetical protein [Candidatus Nanoarchaeia archaeon]
MKKSFAFLVFALLAFSFIHVSTVLADSGSDSGSDSSSESATSGSSSENIEDENEVEDGLQAQDETQLEVRGNRMKFEQKTEANGVKREIKREMKDGVLREEIKEEIRNASGEFKREMKQEVRMMAQAQREERMMEFRQELEAHNGTIMVNKMKIRVANLTDEQKTIIAGKINAKTGLNLSAEDINANGTVGSVLRAYLSNGAYADLKVLPDVAAERAVERMKAKCEERNCSVELKEVGNGNQTRAVYEVKTEKEARMLFVFKTRMKVDAQVDPETGDVLSTHKPWWAFLANEKDETESVAVSENQTQQTDQNTSNSEITLDSNESVEVNLSN